jgi:hypothetical protein
MKSKSIALICVLALLSVEFLRPCQAIQQNNRELIGHIITKVPSKSEMPRFTIKLYPPIETKLPILITTSSNKGDFKFSGLSESSYLLEIYAGKDLVCQQVISVNDTQKPITIDLSGSKTGRGRARPR